MTLHHHIEESQLNTMLSEHKERAKDHISFLVSPPCHTTNFLRMELLEMPVYADQTRKPLMKQPHEVHLDFCSAECGRVASGKCPTCDAPLCHAHRYDGEGQHDPQGICSKCVDQIQAHDYGIAGGLQ